MNVELLQVSCQDPLPLLPGTLSRWWNSEKLISFVTMKKVNGPNAFFCGNVPKNRRYAASNSASDSLVISFPAFWPAAIAVSVALMVL